MASSTSSNCAPTVPDSQVVQSSTTSSKKGLKFWLIFVSVAICVFLSAFEAYSLPTALPTIAHVLHTSDFTWVGTAYALASTAVLPMSGGLAQAFGRRPAILMALGLFALGSGICGGANTMNMLVAGRTIQGLGGGSIRSLTVIILADLVTLQERGVYYNVYLFMWTLAALIGPLIGGVLADAGQWRWIFWLNLPISLLASVSVTSFLDLPTPPGSYWNKFMCVDWIGNFIVILSTVACTIGLTWGGTTAPWSSATVLIPLILGLVGFGVFIAYEAVLAVHPLVPFSLMTNMTSLSGYIQMFLFATTTPAILCKLLPGLFSGLQGGIFSCIWHLPTRLCIIQPYRDHHWIFSKRYQTISAANLDRLGYCHRQFWSDKHHPCNDSVGKSIGYLLLLGTGSGVMYGTAMYPIQAPLAVTHNASALAFLWFLYSFAGVWGITIGSTVLQNELAKNLPGSFLQSLPQESASIYALIPELPSLPSETRYQVQVTFADSLAVLWRVLATVSGAGLLVSFFMKGLPLHNTLDKDWTLKKEELSVAV